MRKPIHQIYHSNIFIGYTNVTKTGHLTHQTQSITDLTVAHI